MLWQDARTEDTAMDSESKKSVPIVRPAVSAPESPTFAIKPTFFHEVLRNTTRSKEECVWLLKGIPKPPSGYRFSHRQSDDQMDFFKFKKETHILPSNLVDCYRYTIIAVCKRHL
jgi:hypothetical protein